MAVRTRDVFPVRLNPETIFIGFPIFFTSFSNSLSKSYRSFFEVLGLGSNSILPHRNKLPHRNIEFKWSSRKPNALSGLESLMSLQQSESTKDYYKVTEYLINEHVNTILKQ